MFLKHLTASGINWLQSPKKYPLSICIIHGNSCLTVHPDGSFCLDDLQSLPTAAKTGKRYRFLIAAPFVFTYIQKTIRLKKSELDSADRHSLDFSRFTTTGRIIESIPLNERQSITTSSHMTDSGIELIKNLRKIHKRLLWEPAIPLFIKRFISIQVSANNPSVNLALDAEMIRMNRKEGNIEFDHLFYWSQTQNITQSIGLAENVLADQSQKSENHSIPLSSLKFVSSEDQRFVSTLLFPNHAVPKIKTVQKKIRKKRVLQIRRISICYLLAVSSLVLTIWSFHIHYTLKKQQQTRRSLLDSVKTLQSACSDGDYLANLERQRIKVESLLTAIASQKMHPVSTISEIASVLPTSYWINGISLTKDAVFLETLDTNQSSLTTISESLEDAYENIRLEESRFVQIEEAQLRKQTLSLTK